MTYKIPFQTFILPLNKHRNLVAKSLPPSKREVPCNPLQIPVETNGVDSAR